MIKYPLSEEMTALHNNLLPQMHWREGYRFEAMRQHFIMNQMELEAIMKDIAQE